MMKATLNFYNDKKVFTALLSNGELLSNESPIALAQALTEAGVLPDDAEWHIWTLENKFEDIMHAVAKGDKIWARLAEFELWRRMS